MCTYIYIYISYKCNTLQLYMYIIYTNISIKCMCINSSLVAWRIYISVFSLVEEEVVGQLAEHFHQSICRPHTCISIYICIYMYTYVYSSLFKCIYIYIFIHVKKQHYTYVCNTYIHIYIYTCAHVYVYTYIHIYTDIHI